MIAVQIENLAKGVQKLNVAAGAHLRLASGDHLNLALSGLPADQVKVFVDLETQDLVLSLPDNGKIILEDLVTALSAEAPPTVTLPNGEIIGTIQDLIAYLSDVTLLGQDPEAIELSERHTAPGIVNADPFALSYVPLVDLPDPRPRIPDAEFLRSFPLDFDRDRDGGSFGYGLRDGSDALYAPSQSRVAINELPGSGGDSNPGGNGNPGGFDRDSLPPPTINPEPRIVYQEDAHFEDFNRDGYADLYITDSYTTNKLLLNDGKGQFTRQDIPNDFGFSREATIVDYDGDGDVDIIVANFTSKANQVWLGDGNGGFTDGSYLLGPTQHSFALSLGVADLNGDGRLDVLASNHLHKRQTLYYGDDNGQLVSSGFSFGDDGRTVKFADFTGDGRTDIFALDDNKNFLFHNKGTGTETHFDVAQTFAFKKALDAVVLDYDNDGDFDIAVAQYGNFGVRDRLRDPNDQNNGQVALLTNDGTGHFTETILVEELGRRVGIDTLDYDHDGQLDLHIVAYGPNAGDQSLFFYNNNGQFVQGTAFPDASLGTRGAFGDILGDGSIAAYIAHYGDYEGDIQLSPNAPVAGTWFSTTLIASDGSLTLGGATITLYDEAGNRVATRVAEHVGNELWYGLTDQDYSLTVTYFLNGEKVVVGAAGGKDVTVVNEAFGHLNPSDTGNVILAAGSGWTKAVNIAGTAYDDVVVSGANADTFKGNGGSDTYVYNDTSVANGAVDRVTDFAAGKNGDRLDIADLLDGYQGNGSLASLVANGFVQLQQNGADTVVRVDTNGGGDQYADIAVLANVNANLLVNDNLQAA